MEEPVISGQNGSGTVFFAHCNLGCIYCQNYKISAQQSHGRKTEPEELAEKMLMLQEQKAENINFVTPTHYQPLVIRSCEIAKKRGLKIPIVYNTGGFENVEQIKELCGTVDIFLTDLKYYSPYYSALYSKCEDYFDFASAATEQMIAQTGKCTYYKSGMLKSGVIIRHLMLPYLLHDTLQIIRYVGENFKDTALFSLMRQYTPVCPDLPPELNRVINDNEYKTAVCALEEYGLEGFIQDSSATGSDKIPVWETDF